MKTVFLAVLCGGEVLFAGCRKTDNTMSYIHAIDSYYSSHPVCLWREPVKFPEQVDASDKSTTASYDALVDQGLLVRTSEAPKAAAIAKAVNSYDLSDKGRSAWTRDQQEPDYGNFCYGHKKVEGIDSSTPTKNEQGAVSEVNYHTTLTDIPAWATAEETQNAYPELHAALAGPQPGEATLIDTNSGWQVGRIQPPRRTS
ncbi:MAG TPA: hypothetical protein VF214_04250 [Edaphobacter sp.]